MIETNLVDFRSLDLDASPVRRNELMKGVASLFAFASERCTLEQIQIYDEVLLRLADMVETEALAHAASKLARLRRAPEGIVRRMATDESIDVAGPVLRLSPVLNEVDLKAAAAKSANSHLKAMAQRTNLSELVTDIIVERGDTDVRRVIAGNTGAVLSDASFGHLVNLAMSDIETAEALGKRVDTPDDLVQKLARSAADNVRRALADIGVVDQEERLSKATNIATERMSNAYWLGLYDFETAWERILNQGGVRAASENLLCQYAIEDRFADVVAVFAILADLDLDAAKHWLVRVDSEPFLVIAKALGLKFATVQAVLKSGPLKHRLSNNDRRIALQHFQELDVRAARTRIAAWQDTRMAG